MSHQKEFTATLNVMDEDDLSEEFVLRENIMTSYIDRGVEFIGQIFSWLWLALLVVIMTNVILRYAFSQGMIELEELQWHLYAAAWLVGLSYTFIADGHVRVDVISEILSKRAQLYIELLGLLLLLMPFIGFIIYYSLPFVHLSWVTGETSTSANGLSARWVVKGCLSFGFILLFLVGFSRLTKVILSLKHGLVSTNKDAKND